MSDSEVPSLSYISEVESMEFFVEGLKQASSAAIQLARAQDHPIWHDISLILDEMNNRGVELANSKPLSRFKTLELLNAREKKMSNTLDEKRDQQGGAKKLIIN